MKNSLEAARKAAAIKFSCKYCSELRSKTNLSKHEKSCYLNPVNIKTCSVCGNIIKHKNRTTCGYSCSNTLYRSGQNNGSYKGTKYQVICFENHKRECVICGEDKIVAVHHLDENHENNSPENLIPLCPTHHSYWHSRFKYLIEDRVREYQRNWLL